MAGGVFARPHNGKDEGGDKKLLTFCPPFFLIAGLYKGHHDTNWNKAGNDQAGERNQFHMHR